MEKALLVKTVKKAQTGDTTALEALYKEYIKRIYFLAVKLMENKEDAEDVAQEVFIYMYQKVSELKVAEAFTTWLNRITTSKCTDYLRKKHVNLNIDDEAIMETEFFEEGDPGLIPDMSLDNAETVRIVTEEVDSLPLPQRVCVYYYYYERLTVAQIAENLNTNENTIKTRLSLARSKIRSNIENLEKRDGIKLYGTAPVALTPLLTKALENFEMPQNIAESILEAVTTGTAAIIAGTAAAGTSGAAAAGVVSGGVGVKALFSAAASVVIVCSMVTTTVFSEATVEPDDLIDNTPPVIGEEILTTPQPTPDKPVETPYPKPDFTKTPTPSPTEPVDPPPGTEPDPLPPGIEPNDPPPGTEPGLPHKGTPPPPATDPNPPPPGAEPNPPPPPGAEPTPTPPVATPTPLPPSLSVGDTIKLGGYDWRVIEVRDGKALVLSQRVLTTRQYHSNRNEDVTWANSDLRAWLNGSFYNNSFSTDEKNRITQTSVSNPNNQWHDTSGGSSTTDRLFILSMGELVRYFGDSGQLANRPSGANYINDQFNSARVSLDLNGRAAWLWIRSPGNSTNRAATTNLDGDIDPRGNHVDNNNGGIRPAMWINAS